MSSWRPIFPLALTLLLGAPGEALGKETPAEQVPQKLSLADRFAGSSVLVEHAFTFLHGQNLSPDYTKSLERMVIVSPSFRASRKLTIGLDI